MDKLEGLFLSISNQTFQLPAAFRDSTTFVLKFRIKARKSCEHGPGNGKRKFNQTRRRSDNERSARVIYTEEEINTFNHYIKLSLLSLGHFMSFRFATKEVKGVNYFPSQANDLEI